MSERGYDVYKTQTQEWILTQGLCVYICLVSLSCLSVCAHHQFCICEAITEIRLWNSNGCPRMSARIRCRDNKSDAKAG